MAHTPCPFESEGCVARERYGECYADEHHRFFPRNAYKTAVERTFRELPGNIEQLCRAEHDDTHASGVIPMKPSRDEMLVAIDKHNALIGAVALEASNG